tara:strand:+ start:265 stop:414 length:150 start_codon:yes stop_codon:yes gene_type:complete
MFPADNNANAGGPRTATPTTTAVALNKPEINPIFSPPLQSAENYILSLF